MRLSLVGPEPDAFMLMRVRRPFLFSSYLLLVLLFPKYRVTPEASQVKVNVVFRGEERSCDLTCICIVWEKVVECIVT